MIFEVLFTEILDFFNIWVFVRTSTNFALLASFQAIEFVDSGQTNKNKVSGVVYITERGEI